MRRGVCAAVLCSLCDSLHCDVPCHSARRSVCTPIDRLSLMQLHCAEVGCCGEATRTAVRGTAEGRMIGRTR